MSAASFLNAFIAWLRDRYSRMEEGKHKWQAYWASVTAPPLRARLRPPPAPTDAPEDPYTG
jgi:hypothetical protein